MSLKKKAKELVNKFLHANKGHFYQDSREEDLEAAKECALIAVDEICKLRLNIGQHLKTDEDKENYYSYWEEVKQEIENL